MKMMIGISGKKRSGKDTLANWIEEKGWYRYGFADPIKSITEIGLGVPTNWANLDANKELPTAALNGWSPRQVWQKIGTEWGRDTIHPDLWLIFAGWHQQKHGSNMVVADVRFENEARWIRDQGGRIIHVRRPALTATTDSHKSESGIEVRYGDITIENDSTLIALRARLEEALTVIGA